MREDRALALVAEGRAAFADVALDQTTFVRHLERHVGDDAEPATLHAGDLYLACACAAGDPRALAHFERLYLTQLGAYVARIDRSADFLDELAQILRARLLLGSLDKPAPILGYSGRGPLGA
jgi:RNA polymerase sigma-70 factor (ECF subfamily)